MQLLQKIGIGPNSPQPRRELHNNLYLIDERAIEAAQQFKQLIDFYYKDRSPGTITTELRLSLNGLKNSTEYTLHWLDRAIERLDKLSSNH